MEKSRCKSALHICTRSTITDDGSDGMGWQFDLVPAALPNNERIQRAI
jgi:hypothetical protein